MNTTQPLRLSGPIQSLGNGRIRIDRGLILTLALDLDTPTFVMEIGDDDKAGNRVVLDRRQAHVGNIEVHGDYLGYVADQRIHQALGFDLFNSKVTAGTFGGSFDIAFTLVKADKTAFVGRRGQKMKELKIDGQSVIGMRFLDDGVYLITARAAYSLSYDDIDRHLAGRPIRASLIADDFESEIFFISRSTDDRIFYLGGDQVAYKVRWGDEGAELLETIKDSILIVGLLAGDMNFVVCGSLTETPDGPAIDISYRPVGPNTLGFGQSA